MRVRVATVDDAAAVAQIHADGILLTVHGDVLNAAGRARLQRERRALWEELLADPPTGQRAFVVDDGQIAGFASAGPDLEDQSEGRVFALFVARDSWGEGLGSRLLEAGEHHLRSDYVSAFLWVVEDNLRARGLYERRGWLTAGSGKHQDGVHFIRYSKCLTTEKGREDLFRTVPQHRAAQLPCAL